MEYAQAMVKMLDERLLRPQSDAEYLYDRYLRARMLDIIRRGEDADDLPRTTFAAITHASLSAMRDDMGTR